MELLYLQEPNVGRVFTVPLGDIYLWSHVSCCCCLDLHAGIFAMGHRYCALHNPQRKARSPSPGYVTRMALLRHLWAHPGRHVIAAVDQGQTHTPRIPLAGSAVLLLFGVYTQTTAEVQPLSVWPGRYMERLSHYYEG